MLNALKAHCKFLGYGNPRAKLWFLGIEEGATESQADAERTLFGDRKACGRLVKIGELDYSHSYFTLEQHWSELQKLTPKKKIRRSPSSVWVYTSKIIAAVEDSVAAGLRYGELENVYKEIGKARGRVFISDVYPLGKRRQSDWPFEKWFSRELYESIIAEERFPRLAKARPAESVVIGHGKSVWRHLRQIFCSVEEKPIRILNRGRRLAARFSEEHTVLEVYPESKVILCPFFSTRVGMNEKIVLDIATWARKFLGTKAVKNSPDVEQVW